jgi:folate-binding protein YgfZ
MVVDRSTRGRLRVGGADGARFLQGMLTADVAQLTPGASTRAAMLTPKGRVVADLLVGAEADGYRLSTEPGLGDKLREALSRYVVIDEVTIEDESERTAELGVYGPGALAATAEMGELVRLGAPLGVHLYGEPAAVARATAALQAGGAQPISAEAAEILRIERGVSRYFAEISEEVLPLEVGLEDAISLTKGCYVGQEPIARVTARGHVNRKVVGLLCRELARAGDTVATAERPEAGVVTSAARSETLGRPIALALLHRSAWTPGTPVTVGEGNEAEVAALPMVEW